MNASSKTDDGGPRSNCHTVRCDTSLPEQGAPIHAAVSKLPIELWSCIRVMFADQFRSDFGADL
jgi:hypothetical protein